MQFSFDCAVKSGGNGTRSLRKLPGQSLLSPLPRHKEQIFLLIARQTGREPIYSLDVRKDGQQEQD